MKQLMIGLLGLITLVVTQSHTNDYTMTAKVRQVTNDLVLIETTDGELFDFKAEGFDTDDYVKVTFDSKDTLETKADDAIVSVDKYESQLDGELDWIKARK